MKVPDTCKNTALLAAISLSLGQLAAAQEQAAGEVVDEITVYGLRSSLQDARNQQRFADNLRDVLAAEDAGKLPDGNIAEALNRVSSVYLQSDQGEGRYVSIRGIDPTLNNVTFNGQSIAVSDTDGRSGRAAPLDVLSASSVSYIEVHKVTTPDMDGQSIGGSINVRTPSAFDFDGLYMSANADIGYNDFGSEGDMHSMGGDWASRFGPNQTFGVYVSGNYMYREYLSHVYVIPRVDNPANGVEEDSVFPDRIRFGSAIGERERMNFTANMEYRPSQRDDRMWLRYYWTEYTDVEERPEFTLRNRGDLGAVNNREFFWTRLGIESKTRYERQERPVSQLVLGGDFALTDQWRVESNINKTNAKEINPFLTYSEVENRTSRGNLADGAMANPISLRLNDEGFAIPSLNPDFSNGLTAEDMAFHNISRFRDITSDVEEDTLTFDVDLTWDGNWSDRPVTFKAGAKWIDRDKSVDDQDTRFPYLGDLNLESAGAGTFFQDVGRGEAYSQFGFPFRIPVPDINGYRAFFESNREQFRFDEAGSAANSIEDDYTMNEQIASAYAMVSVDVLDTLILIGGVRVERTDVEVSAFSFISAVETSLPPELSRVNELPFGTSDIIETNDTNSFTSVLPSVIMRWEVAPEWLMRASVSTNIGRPDYPDLAPISTLAVVEDGLQPGRFSARNEIGNPDLDPLRSTNYDLSLDYYLPEEAGVVSVGGFYKSIEDTIFSFIREETDFTFAGVLFDDYRAQTLDNARRGHVSGLEFSLQYDFVSLAEPFDGFGFLANAALIDSGVRVNQRPGEELPFFNQADRIYNAQVYYEKYGFQGRLAWSYQSEALFGQITSDAANDLYRAPRESLDLKLSYQINDQLRVSFSGKNLTNEADRNYVNGNQFYTTKNVRKEIYGREYRLGLTWALQ